ncbi:MAG: ABC transporter ATP-binding protein [Bacillota bacterium]|jgi:branched-chain amino acid transport system ATP-binding protein|nr:ABC transporter ATP-binding protein [Bacillota bacterium]HHU29973.1 ABC transporter ATP-binding protein [Bacillota bacterium]
MLEVKNLNTYYDNVQILWDVSLQIGEGEIVALLGANGAGKTTLLNSLTGLVRPAAGSVAFLGQEITNLPTNEIVELGIAYLPEGGRLFPDMTVQENLELGSYLKNSWKIRNKRLKEVYSIFPRLKERRKQLAKTLSGGERQMLAMGRCLMSGPKMCFFDELSYGLAPKLVKESFAMLKTLRDHGITIFMIEQNVNQSLEIADRAYVLENGRIALEGTSEELLKSDHVRKAYLGL